MKLSHLLRRDPAAPTLRERANTLREGLSRRDAVLGAAVAAVPLPALASGQPAQHPDADLIALWQRREEAHRAERAAAAKWDEIPDADDGPTPQALLVRDDDRVLGIASHAYRREDGSAWYCVGEPGCGYGAAALREPRFRNFSRLPRLEDNLPADAWAVLSSEPWPEAQARADEIVAAWDAWQVDIARRNEASGLNAAKAAWSEQDRILDAIDDEIAAVEAHTIAGLTIKARLARVWDERGYRDADTLAASIVAGLIALDTPNA